jgi:hypothetical protein
MTPQMLHHPKTKLHSGADPIATAIPTLFSAYCDVWYYTDAQGKAVHVEESVLDMVKTLT